MNGFKRMMVAQESCRAAEVRRSNNGQINTAAARSETTVLRRGIHPLATVNQKPKREPVQVIRGSAANVPNLTAPMTSSTPKKESAILRNIRLAGSTPVVKRPNVIKDSRSGYMSSANTTTYMTKKDFGKVPAYLIKMRDERERSEKGRIPVPKQIKFTNNSPKQITVTTGAHKKLSAKVRNTNFMNTQENESQPLTLCNVLGMANTTEKRKIIMTSLKPANSTTSDLDSDSEDLSIH